MRLALLFSGQGGQTPAHWRQLVETGDTGLLSAVSAVVPEFHADKPSPSDWLAENKVAQPLIFAQQMALWAELRDRLPQPVCVAGYSLGEMAACCVAGAFSPIQGVGLCAMRAALMDQAAPGEYGMLAVLGLAEAQVARLASAAGFAIAIRNAPRHLVLAGPQAARPELANALAAAGATRLVELAVRTPSHTARLAPAALAFGQHLAALADARLCCPVLSAIDATPARRATPALAALARQLAEPLDWAACLQAIREMQPDAVLEIGPGNALARLFGELAPEIPVRASDDFRSCDGIVGWLASCTG